MTKDMRTLLVTGGAGFIGSNFIVYWMKRHPEDRIMNLDIIGYAGKGYNLSSISNNPNYVFKQGDICDRKTVDTLMKETDIVVHFAAETHVDRSINDPFPFVKSNVEGTYTLLESARHHKNITRFHHISTDEVFGSLELNSQEKFDDNTPYNPRNPYSASKASSDHFVRAYHKTFGLPVTISNCSNNFGPYQHPEKLIPLAITNILEGKKAPLYGDGKNVRDWLYVEDHCRAIELILKKGTIGKTYLIGGQTEDTSNKQVLHAIVSAMGKDESFIEYVTDRPGHDLRYAVDWSTIHKELGWKPQYNFQEALKKTVQWYKDNEEWWKKIRN